MYSTIHEVARATLRFADFVGPQSRSPILDPRNLMRAGWMSLRHGAESIDRVFRGERGRVAHAELDNRIRAFRLFETVASTLDLQPGDLDVTAVISKAEARLGQEGAVWASEGLGYELGRRLLAGGGALSPLPRPEFSGALPGSWAVLNTGAGMALAESFLNELDGGSDLRLALRSHLENCQRLAGSAEAAMVFEPLGFAVRLLRPDLVAALDTELRKWEAPWVEFFWHGVGRGIYFLPVDLSPLSSAPWKGWARCRKEASEVRALQNLRAGFAWALTLVNLETPGVAEIFLAHHSEGGEAIVNGMASALGFWERVTGGSRSQRRFVAHVASPGRRELWQRFVSGPDGASLPGTHESWSELYRYREQNQS